MSLLSHYNANQILKNLHSGLSLIQTADFSSTHLKLDHCLDIDVLKAFQLNMINISVKVYVCKGTLG